MIPYVFSKQFRTDILALQSGISTLTTLENQMAVSQADFDTIFVPYLTSVASYVTAAEAYFVAAQAALGAAPGLDLTTEANDVTAAKAALATAIAAIPADPGVPVPVVTSGGAATPPPATP